MGGKRKRSLTYYAWSISLPGASKQSMLMLNTMEVTTALWSWAGLTLIQISFLLLSPFYRYLLQLQEEPFWIVPEGVFSTGNCHLFCDRRTLPRLWLQKRLQRDVRSTSAKCWARIRRRVLLLSCHYFLDDVILSITALYTGATNTLKSRAIRFALSSPPILHFLRCSSDLLV